MLKKLLDFLKEYVDVLIVAVIIFILVYVFLTWYQDHFCIYYFNNNSISTAGEGLKCGFFRSP